MVSEQASIGSHIAVRSGRESPSDGGDGGPRASISSADQQSEEHIMSADGGQHAEELEDDSGSISGEICSKV